MNTRLKLIFWAWDQFLGGAASGWGWSKNIFLKPFHGLSVYDTTVLIEYLFLVMSGPETDIWVGQDGGVTFWNLISMGLPMVSDTTVLNKHPFSFIFGWGHFLVIKHSPSGSNYYIRCEGMSFSSLPEKVEQVWTNKSWEQGNYVHWLN